MRLGVTPTTPLLINGLLTMTQKNRKLPLGKGQRFVISHAGCEDGFLNGCELVFKGISTDGREYHNEMNSKIFEKWVNEQLESALPEKSLIIMDNASYHSVREEGTKTPTSNSRKGDMISWLTKNNINFNNKAKKPELYGIVKLNKGPPIYKVDEFLKRKGHEVLRLPPYHCELNPIELIWGDLKGFVGREHSTIKREDVKALIKKGFAQIDSAKWLHVCEHVNNSTQIDSAKWLHACEHVNNSTQIDSAKWLHVCEHVNNSRQIDSAKWLHVCEHVNNSTQIDSAKWLHACEHVNNSTQIDSAKWLHACEHVNNSTQIDSGYMHVNMSTILHRLVLSGYMHVNM